MVETDRDESYNGGEPGGGVSDASGHVVPFIGSVRSEKNSQGDIIQVDS